MPVVKPQSSIVFQWSTGTRANEKIHSVSLQIPPSQISLKLSKNTQKQVTTQGWVINHGLDNLGIITASGQAYIPRNANFASKEGFNSNIKLSGLELLHSAYISSGKLSSDPELTSTISSSLLKSTRISKTGNSTPIQNYISKLSNRVNILNTIKNKSIEIANIGLDNLLSFSDSEISYITQSSISSLKNMLGSDLHTLSITQATKNQIMSILNSLDITNVDFKFRELESLFSQNSNLQSLVSKFDYFLNLFKNQNQGLNILGIDPSISTFLKRDPFVLLKSTAGKQIYNKLVNTTQQSLSKIISQQQNQLADDWIITIYLFWQDMIFVGNFENFDMTQQAQVLDLWNWSFTYTIHDGYLVKGNKIIPFMKAFDPSVTKQYSPGSRVDEYRNRHNGLENILFSV